MAVAVLAPLGRDAELAATALRDAPFAVQPVADAGALCEALARPETGVVVLTAEALRLPGLDGVARRLAAAPDWSDVPFVLFMDGPWEPRDHLRLTDALGGHTAVTVLERPIRPVAFRSVVALAVATRRQQLRVRDLLARVEGFNAELRERVEEQTAQLRRRAEEVEALAQSLSEAELRERERIAQILHDDVQQILFGVRLQVQMLGGAVGQAADADRIGGHIDEAIAQTRLLATELHPSTLAGDGIAAAIGWVADFARRRHDLTVHLDAVDGAEAPAPESLALLTRTARELLFNVVKHAGTGEAWVRTWCDAEGCHLSVRDEGPGFAADEGRPTGLGLADLRHRLGVAGGSLTVEPGPRGGATVTAVLPTR